MSEVNKQVYPDRTTALSGIQLSSTRAAECAIGIEWEKSIAISQSTSELAPYNNMTYVSVTPNVAPTPNVVVTKTKQMPLQTLMLYYTQDLIEFGHRNQYYSNSVTAEGETFIIRDVNEFDYWFYSTKRYPIIGSWTTNVVNTCQSHYNFNNYYTITGADFKKILGVICVRFSDFTYCSLKYYKENKNGSLASKTPSSLFMIGLIDNDGGQYLQSFYLMNMEQIDWHFWRLVGSTYDEFDSNDTDKTASRIPSSVSGGLNLILGSKNVGSLTSPSCAIPLVGCMNGGSVTKLNFWNNKQRSSVPVFGGKYNYHYTLREESNAIIPVLSQYAFDDARKIAATMGVPFSEDFPTTLTNFYSASNGLETFIPIANDGGYFDGKYELLSENGVINTNMSEANFAIWNGGKDAPYNNRAYDPTVPISTDVIDLITPALTPSDCFNKTYILNRDDVEELASVLWTTDQGILDQLLHGFAAWFSGNPIDGIINLMLFPFDVRTKTGSQTTVETLRVGAYDINTIQCYRLGNAPSARYTLGSFTWNSEFGDSFLDYSPYTEAELYIPYFGTIPLSPEHFLNKTIQIDLVVDFTNGSATAIVFVKENNAMHPVIYKNGTIAVSIPLTGDDARQRFGAIMNTAMNYAGGLKTSLSNLLGGGKTAPEQATNPTDGNGQLRLMGPVQSQGAVSPTKLATEAAENAALTATPAGLMASAGLQMLGNLPSFSSATMFNQAGSSTPDCALYLPKNPYIILYRPKIDELENYGHLIGYATMQDCTIGDCTGFSKFSNIDLSGVNATKAEKDILLSLLESGVYL